MHQNIDFYQNQLEQYEKNKKQAQEEYQKAICTGRGIKREIRKASRIWIHWLNLDNQEPD